MFQNIRQKAPLGLIYAFGSGFINIIIYTFFPKILFHHPKIHFTHLIAISVWGGALFQYPIRLLTRYLARSTILRLINIVVMAIIPLSAFFFNSLWLIGCLAVLGGCLFSIYPMVIGYTCHQFKKEDYFNIIQTLLLTYGIGGILAPFVLILLSHIMNNFLATFGTVFMMNMVLFVLSFIVKRSS